MEDSPALELKKKSLDQLIGLAVKTHRRLAELTLSELSASSGVSTAMISKIERGQVSASLATLEALAEGIGVPLINFFAATVERSDASFVAAGEGVTVQRLGSGYGHSYKLIGRAEAKHVSFESFSVTLEAPLDARPLYQHQGVEFIHVTDGEMVYGCGDASYHMRPGDSLSFDSNVSHGPIELKTPKVKFVTVVAKAIIGGT
ncbi:HTH-type transcriptional regulator PuuR [Ruegeria denitrificans]|uniref:HTH-type transcriptional regulator PuuR n=1 Tax=Ruegeria denitrificans TaxID=1715692 RepID=A0A0P1IZY3_9RHOB|nr:XRE family transcriptional regulator [Ruegeria denitrificans]CUK18368.1 HTH-type transcriptional regulator PuuR [Ruegeria denitrificans]